MELTETAWAEDLEGKLSESAEGLEGCGDLNEAEIREEGEPGEMLFRKLRSLVRFVRMAFLLNVVVCSVLISRIMPYSGRIV
jgi:hypothetical protein